MVRAEDGRFRSGDAGARLLVKEDTEICRLMASIKEAEREPTGKDRRFEENNRRSIETEREGTRGTRSDFQAALSPGGG